MGGTTEIPKEPVKTAIPNPNRFRQVLANKPSATGSLSLFALPKSTFFTPDLELL